MTEELKTKVAVIEVRVEGHAEALKSTVHKHQFDPVQKIVYGLAGMVLLAVGAAIVKLVVLQNAAG